MASHPLPDGTQAWPPAMAASVAPSEVIARRAPSSSPALTDGRRCAEGLVMSLQPAPGIRYMSTAPQASDALPAHAAAESPTNTVVPSGETATPVAKW